MSTAAFVFRRLEYRTAAYEPLASLYRDALGLHELRPGLLRAPDGAFELSFEEPARAETVPAPGGAAHAELGLYHTAFLLPSREALAAVLRRLFAAVRGATERRGEHGTVGPQFHIEGAADHGVSEAVYLRDADGNGVELYADRDTRGDTAMDTHELDMAGLMACGSGTDGLCSGSSIGHLHLHVPDLDQAQEFYRKHLQLQVTYDKHPGARFLAWGSYHHHLGLNTWAAGVAASSESHGLARVVLAPQDAGTTPGSHEPGSDTPGSDTPDGREAPHDRLVDPAGIIWSW